MKALAFQAWLKDERDKARGYISSLSPDLPVGERNDIIRFWGAIAAYHQRALAWAQIENRYWRAHRLEVRNDIISPWCERMRQYFA